MNTVKKFGIVALVLTALTGMIPITAKAAGDSDGEAPRTISATLDKGGVNYKEGETAKVTLDFSDTFMESSWPGYLFLVPLDEATSNLVEITSQSDVNHTTSVLVYPGFSRTNSQASILLKDGYDGCLLNFGIELRDSNDNTQDNIIAEWEGKPFTIGVDNVMPQITYIEMNDIPLTTNGGTFRGAVPAGVQKTFTLGIRDPASEVDFADGDKAYTQLTFKENGVAVETKIIPGLPTGKTVTHRFTTLGTAQVVAKVRDKDMTDQEFAAAPEFTANITVVDAPTIILTPHSGSIIFNETDTGLTAGRIDVELTVPPSGLDVGESITVVLEVPRNGLNDGSLPVLDKYEVPFRNGQTTGYVYFKELDGTAESEMRGFRINAYIKETTPSTFDPSKTWREIYQPAELDFFVRNVYPQIVTDIPSGEELSATINVPFSINWSVNDSPADLQGMRATLTFGGNYVSMTLDPSTNVYTKEVVFTSAGYQTINLTVEDKDGASNTFTWYVRVGVPDDRQKEQIGDYTWSYRIENGGAVITGLMDMPAISPSPEGALNIPSELGGCPVVGIVGDAFGGCENLISVTIPSSVTSIGYSAFLGCSGLTSVVIPSSVTSIGNDAFRDCSGLTSVTIPSSVTSIEYSAFLGCSGMMSFVVDVDNPAYCSLNGLLCSKDGKTVITGVSGDVTIPSGVTSIGIEAFYGYDGLTSIVIPSGVTRIEPWTFYGCSGLTSLTISEGVTSIESEAFYGCSGLTSLTIPSSVTRIGSFAFGGCSGLTSATLPSGINIRMTDVFRDSHSLTSLTIYEGVNSASIGNNAFRDCSGLTSVTISEGVTSIGDYAFQNCIGLTSVTIPSSVTSIGYSAFLGCSGMMSFVVDVDNPAYCSLNGLLCSKDGKTVITGVSGDVTIPSGVTSIGDYAFQNCIGLTSVTIPSSVTSIGKNAFRDCSGMTSVTIPSSVTSIGNNAFWDCGGMTSVALPSSVTNIGYYAFYDCERLSTVYVEKGDAARVRGLLEGSWSYLDCDSISFVEDWVRVDETVILTSAEIEAEMVKYPTLAALAGNDVEAFAKLPSAVGKVDAAGNQMHVWQDIVAGTDPTDPDDLFKVTAIVMENGEIKVSWSPDLNENGTKNVRRYIQYGSKTIGESAAWVDISTVAAAERNDYKFRKVTVGMP